MACTLSARGKDFDVEAFLARTKLPIKQAIFWIRGTPSGRRKPTLYQDSGFSAWVSNNKWDNLRAAVAEVLKFLQSNKKELAKLKRTNGLEDLMLDFGFHSRVGTKNIAVQGEYLPPEFLRLAGELNIGDGLSIYPPMMETKEKKKQTLVRKSKKQQTRKQG